MIKDNYLAVKQRVASACLKADRKAESVTIIAVSKNRSAVEISEAVDAGVTDIGENRVQEAITKYKLLTTNECGAKRSLPVGGQRVRSEAEPPQRGRPTTNNQRPTAIKWHMLGHLQSNKVKEAVRIFDLIHSVDSLRLAEEIDKQAGRISKVQDVLIEVKTSPEETKSGILPEEAGKLLAEISGFKNIAVKGLMTIAPLVSNSEAARLSFRRLRDLRDQLTTSAVGGSAFGGNDQRLTILSMGMTDDFTVAIEEGATMIRVGRAIFES